MADSHLIAISASFRRHQAALDGTNTTVQGVHGVPEQCNPALESV